MKNRLGRFLPLFVCLLFFLPAFTSWSAEPTSVTINAVDPTGQVYHGTVTVAWQVIGDDTGENYDVGYSTVGSSGPWTSIHTSTGNGSASYSFSWNTSTVSDGSNYWISVYNSTSALRSTDGTFTIQNTGPIISITAPQAGTVISGTTNINWNVTNTWASDYYRIQYRYSATGDPGTVGSFTDITTVDTTIRTYALNTTLYETGYYRLKVLGTASGSWDSVYVIIDQNAVTGITILHPLAADKCRGNARIQWNVTGTPRINETWLIEYSLNDGGTWSTLTEITDPDSRTYDWDTSSINSYALLKITATSSDVDVQSAEFVIDNTEPEVYYITITPDAPNGMLPDVRIGRSTLFVIPSGWYSDRTPATQGDDESYPLIKVKAMDPKVNDSCAGIYGIAYRIYSDQISGSGFTGWTVLSGADLTPLNDYESTGEFYLNVEGNVVYVEVVVIDDARYSLDNSLPPNDTNFNSSIYSADTNCWGNFSPLYTPDGTSPDEDLNDYWADGTPATTEFPFQVDVTPPSIDDLWVDHLPDGPVIGDIQWYPADVSKRPLILIEANYDDELSGIFEDACFHTVDGTSIPLIQIPYDGDGWAYYTLNPLNGEIVTLINSGYTDCPGIKDRGGYPLDYYRLAFPVYNAYGKQPKARIWDRAGNISAEFTGDPLYDEGGLNTTVHLYVDNIPPVSTVALANNYWPTSPLDVGSKLRGYWDTWRQNKNFPRPEDAAPPASYTQGWIDYLYIASNQNPTGLTAATFTISTDDVPASTVPYRRYYEIFNDIYGPHADWLIQYDYFFSDFSATNLGAGVSDTFSSPWYRYRQTDETTTDSAVLADINGVWTDSSGTDAFYVGEKGVAGEWDGSEWDALINSDTNNLNAIWGTDAAHLWAVGDGGTILYNNGSTWTSLYSGTVQALHGIWGDGTGNLWAVGAMGTILYSPDFGINWFEQDSYTTVTLHSITGSDANDLVAVGDGGTVLATSDGGTTWIPAPSLTGGNLYGVWGKDFGGDGDMDLVMAGNIEYVDGSNRYIGYLYMETDTSTWELKSTGISAVTGDNFSRLPIYGVTGDSAGNTIYITGARGTILKGTYSGGDFTWTDLSPNLPSDVTATLRSAGVDGSGNLHIVGDAGRTLYSSDGGTTWSTENLWSNWISGATSAFTLNPGTTALEYFALDDLGNEEPHHKIIDPGDGTVKTITDGKGLGNMRTDDNVPEPDAILNPASPDTTGWYNLATGAPTVTLTFNDTTKWNDYLPDGVTPGSGIRKFQYGLGTGTSPAAIVPNTDYTFGLPVVLTNGMYALSYRAVDHIGNTNGDTTTPYIPYGGNPIKIDLVRPATTVALVSGKLQLTATDNLSGVKMIRYKIDSTPTGNTDGTQYTEPLSMIGVTTVYYWAEDNAGNFENYNTYIPGNEDSVPPITTIAHYSGAFYEDILGTRYIASSGNANSLLVTRFSLSSTDPSPGTGILTGYPVYSFNDTDYFSYLTPFAVPAGSSSIYFYARDGFGNIETTKQYDFVIDDTAPSAAIVVTCDDDGSRYNGWYNILSGVPTVTINVTEAGSGTAYVRYDITGGTPATDYTAPFTLSGGTHNVVARSADNVGNLSSDTTYDYNPIQVDIVAPVSTLTPSSGTFYLSATDNYSGVEYLKYVFILSDDSRSDTVTYSGTSTSFAPASGTKQVEYWSVDAAGNEEAHRTYSLSGLDDTPPVTTVSVYSGHSYTDLSGLWITSTSDTELGATQLQVTASDPADSDTGFSSGVALGYPVYQINTDGPTWIEYTTPFSVANTDTSVWAYAEDGVGNTETPHVEKTFTIDDTAPYGSTFAIDPVAPSAITGWYNTDTGAPTITISGTTDDGCGVKEVRYTTNGTDPSSTNGNVYTVPVVLNNTEISEIRYAGFDNLGHMEAVGSYVADILVDTVAPVIVTAVDYPNRQFSLTVTDNLSGVDWTNVTYEFVLEDDSTDGPYTYTEGTSVDIPADAKNMHVVAMDVAGNISEQTTTFSTTRKISGYIRNYKSAALAGVKVVLCGDTSAIKTSSAAGYYEFTGLRALGTYYVVPVLTNNLPVCRYYEVLGDVDKTNQDFTTYPGWMSARYDRGGSRDYLFGSTLTALSPLTIAESASLPAAGTKLLSGFLSIADQRVNALMSDGSRVRGYVYNSGTSSYTNAISRTTGFNLSLVGSVREDTTIDIVLCGTGNDIAEIRDNTGENIREVTTGVLDVALQAAPGDTEWSTNFSLGQGGILFTGAGTGYNVAFLYNYLTDSSVWETSLTQDILPGTSSLCMRDNGRAIMLTGRQSDTTDLTLAALDVMTGETLWTKIFSGIRGKITPVVFVDEDGWDGIFAVRTSTNTSTGMMRVYQLNPATGATLNQWTGFNYTPNENTSFRAAVADLDGTGIKKLVLSDGSGNMYVLDFGAGNIVSSAEDRGILWAVADFDGQTGKEIIVSADNELRVLSPTLEVLASRDMGVDDIENVIVSDMKNSGQVNILVSIPGSTRILRAALSTDVPGTPTGIDAYSSDGKAYIVWAYTATTTDLSGFRIWRSTDPGDPNSWVLAGTVTSGVRSYVDSPDGGIYAYKVSAYNDFGETYSGSVSVEVVEVSSDSGGTASCFIATAAFGTPMAREVVTLKKFRDEHLLKNRAGSAFVRWYYRHSPAVADYIRQRKAARALVRASLRPLLWILSFR